MKNVEFLVFSESADFLFVGFFNFHKNQKRKNSVILTKENNVAYYIEFTVHVMMFYT
jgi:hypothetical protein